MRRILLADDHALMREGIKSSLNDAPDIEIVGEACDGLEALEMAASLMPDIIVADISMPRMTGIEMAREIKSRHPSIKVLILSTHHNEQYILESFEAGALGYLPKDAPLDQIILAIETITFGNVFYTPDVAKILAMAAIKQAGPEEKPIITLREKEILALLVEGHTNKEIAARLFISVRTVDAHRRNIMKKLDVNNSAELVRITMEKKLV